VWVSLGDRPCDGGGFADSNDMKSPSAELSPGRDISKYESTALHCSVSHKLHFGHAHVTHVPIISSHADPRLNQLPCYGNNLEKGGTLRQALSLLTPNINNQKPQIYYFPQIHDKHNIILSIMNILLHRQTNKTIADTTM
jgi:hypothetical protein